MLHIPISLYIIVEGIRKFQYNRPPTPPPPQTPKVVVLHSDPKYYLLERKRVVFQVSGLLNNPPVISLPSYSVVHLFIHKTNKPRQLLRELSAQCQSCS